MGQEMQIAVFIDYDNIEISVEDTFGKNTEVDWNRIFQYAGQVGGRVVLRRAYADWAEAKDKQRGLLTLGVDLVHVNSKRGKNAADIRIVIDALELLYGERDVFTHVLLVSGDGDFTELVHRLRAHGKTVIGLGISGTTAEYLVNACDKFVYYDKWQGVNKQTKKAQPSSPPPQVPPPSAPKPNNVNSPAAKTPLPAATTPEGKFEQYGNLLAAKKIRVAENKHRPLVIYKIYELVKNDAEQLNFNQLKEKLEAFYAEETQNVSVGAALDVAYQLFHTFCFEFDPDSHDRIFNRKMFFAADVQKASDLLDKCDRKIINQLASDLGSSEVLDKEIIARILYGNAQSPKIVQHVEDLLAAL